MGPYICETLIFGGTFVGPLVEKHSGGAFDFRPFGDRALGVWVPLGVGSDWGPLGGGLFTVRDSFGGE